MTFEEILKANRIIMAICLDNNLAEDYSYILSYFHIRTKILNTINLIEEDKVGYESILFLLGKNVNDFDNEFEDELIQHREAINKIDIIMRDNFGKENLIRSQLNLKLKLYEDREYFEKVKYDYFTLITPNFPFYNDEKVKNILGRELNKDNKKDDIDELLESIRIDNE